MTSIWNFIDQHAKVLGFLVAAMSLIVTAIAVVKPLLSSGFPEPALKLSSLRDSRVVIPYPGFKVRPVDGGESPLCVPGAPLYGVGFKLNKFTLAHDRRGPNSIEVRSIRIVHVYSPDHVDAYRLQANLSGQQGLGPKEPYSFFAYLNGKAVSFDDFVSPDGRVHRPERNDLLAGEGGRSIELTDRPGDDTAILDGTIEASEPGVYSVHLEADYTVSGKPHTESTDSVCIINKME